MSGADAEPALAQALRAAVLAQDFGATPDRWQAGAPLGAHPSIDLAVIVFAPALDGAPAQPRWANVLFSREHPQGVTADIDAHAGALRNVRFDADLQGADGDSIAWLPGADWHQLPWRPLAGLGALRFVAPYPASLLKLMVAVGVGLAVDRGLTDWPDALEPMIVVSDNDATDTCVALLHRVKMVDALNRRLSALGLATLQLNDTQPSGGWRNADGAGVGHIHMTAWDTARLLWLLDLQAPPPPWLPAGTRLLSDVSAAHLHGVLRRQKLDEILSSGSLRDAPGCVAGLPDAPAFAHKTGTTDNYASDAGIVQTGELHAIVAVLTSLGRRYAPHEGCATTWRLPALGAAVHGLLRRPR
jgi:hypothetical protein